MGYTTEFKGKLEFVGDYGVQLLREIKQYLGKDMRELDPEWAKANNVTYIDLELTEDLDGIEWTGVENTYGMVASVNWLIQRLRKEWPAFTLKGELQAQGEAADDRWVLRIKNGLAVKVANPPKGTKATCPDCGCTFYVE